MVTALDQNTALVIIDLQKGIAQRQLVKPLDNILENTAKLVAAFRRAALPIVIVNVNPANATWIKARKDASSASHPAFKEDALDILPEIKSQSNDIFITKHTWSAFYETALEEELKKRNVTGIVLAGVSTSAGVEGTARSASERGYNITFAIDAITDMIPEAHENSLKYIFPRLGEIGDTDKIVEMLC